VNTITRVELNPSELRETRMTVNLPMGSAPWQRVHILVLENNIPVGSLRLDLGEEEGGA
jgi:hypothetical protein